LHVLKQYDTAANIVKVNQIYKRRAAIANSGRQSNRTDYWNLETL